MRQKILEIFMKWDNSSFYIDHLLENEELDAFSYRIVKGVIEKLYFLDYQIDGYLRNSVSGEILWILRMAFYELIFNNSAKDYAVVNEAVNLAKIYDLGKKGMVNGVLRNFLRDNKKIFLPEEKKEYLSVKYSFPNWLTELFIENYGISKTERLFEYFEKKRYTDLRINSKKITRDDYMKKLTEKGVSFSYSNLVPFHIRILEPIKIKELYGFEEGFFYVQDLAAQIISSFVAPISGALLDVGSAPGGKITYFSQINEQNFPLYAIESSKRRIKKIKQNIERLGAKNIEIINANFLSYEPELKFKHIFLDLPCSGLGVLSKKIDIKYRLKKEDIASLVEIQRKMLKKAFSLLDEDGEIVYSTCTLNNIENLGVISAALNKNREFEIFDLEKKKYLHNSEDNDIFIEGKCFAPFPPDADMDGMFACVIKRR